jgi:RNA polymerase sigma factor (sigma-70 family)
MQQTILYNGSEVVVSKEVAEFLDGERRREQAEERSDRRHKDFTDLETAIASIHKNICGDPVSSEVIRKDTLERLRKVIRDLDDESRRLIELHYYEERSLTATAESFGISKQALSKRHAQLLKKMRKSMET